MWILSSVKHWLIWFMCLFLNFPRCGQGKRIFACLYCWLPPSLSPYTLVTMLEAMISLTIPCRHGITGGSLDYWLRRCCGSQGSFLPSNPVILYCNCHFLTWRNSCLLGHSFYIILSTMSLCSVLHLPVPLRSSLFTYHPLASAFSHISFLVCGLLCSVFH